MIFEQPGQEDSEIVNYYRYSACDMCVTRTRLEEASSQTHQSEKVDKIGAYNSVVAGGRNSGFENSVKKRDLLLKEGLEATKRWRNNIKDAIATVRFYNFVFFDPENQLLLTRTNITIFFFFLFYY